jgi:hypothetical protein
VKSTGENEESFPAFDDLFDEDAAQEEENESPAVEEKVEVKVILKEISISKDVPGKAAGFRAVCHRRCQRRT